MTSVPHHFVRRIDIEAPAHDLFGWHEKEGVLERLIPPWENVEVLHHSGHLRDGARATIRAHLGPVSFDWQLAHEGYVAGRQFQDRQVSGPFSSWQHTHRVIDRGTASTLEDEIEFRLPMGWLGNLARPLVEAKLDRMFRFRHRVTKQDLETAAPEIASQTLAMTGASGLVGTAVAAFLRSHGHRVLPMVRRAAGEGEIPWNADGADWDPTALEGVDTIVHLAGENIAGGRWTQARKDRIQRSRVTGTRSLVAALCPPGAQTSNVDLRLGHRFLRRPRGRNPGRDEPCWIRFPAEGLPGVGGGGTPGRGTRHPCGLPAPGSRAVPERRRAEEDAATVPGRRRRPPRERATVPELDLLWKKWGPSSST